MAKEVTNLSLAAKLLSLPSRTQSRIALRDPHCEYRNTATAIAPRSIFLQHGTQFPALDAHSLFVKHYTTIRAAARLHHRLGILIFAFDALGNTLGEMWLAATNRKTRSAIIGRHDKCDLAIPYQHDDISLRHLAILARASGDDKVNIRVLDLRTAFGFADEQGRLLSAVSSRGTLFLTLGNLSIVILVTDDQELPESADQAYSGIPERVFAEEKPGQPMQSWHGIADSPQHGSRRNCIYVTSRAGPVAFADILCGTQQSRYGTLVIRTSTDTVRRQVSLEALERGILVGRYERCDIGIAQRNDSRLSRVHLLIIRDGADIVAIDTASTNGTSLDDKEILLERVSEGDTLRLAEEMEISWHLAA